MAKVKKKKHLKGKSVVDLITGVRLDEKGAEEYKDYATAMIEDRYVIGSLDGVKPVMRRTLWATHLLGLTSSTPHRKSAEVVGRVLGDFHPHGDTACYGAIVTAANSSMRTIDGHGNWGSMVDKKGFAAMRYTNMRLSKYGELCFFDKFYLPTVQFISNYNGSKQEPLNLPAMLPNVLLNGNFGMGPGVSTRIPAFTLKSVIKVLKKVIADGGTATVDNVMGLVPTSEYGGFVQTDDKDTRKELRQFYKTGIGSLTFWSSCTDPDKNNSIRYDRFAPLPDDLSNKLEAIARLNGVKSIDDDSERTDPYKAAFTIKLLPKLKGKERRQVLDAIDDVFSAEQRVDLKVTDRVLNAKGTDADISLRSTNVPTVINDWLRYRVDVEKKACQHWTAKCEARIAHLKLMIHAISHLDIILKSLKVEDSAGYLVKHLKIKIDQANMILDLKVRQLKKLEINTLQAQIKDLQKEIAGFAARIKKPLAYINQHLDVLWSQLKDEAARQQIPVKE